MRRRDFLYVSGIGVGASMLQSIPVIGRDIAIEEALMPIDVSLKKKLADIALNAARSKGATYADVRIGTSFKCCPFQRSYLC